MTDRNAPKSWERTRVAGLYRHAKSGRYYARVYLSGKEKWKALGTNVFSVATVRMADKARETTRQRQARTSVDDGTATLGQLADDYLARVESNEDLKPASKAARRHAVQRLRRTWSGFDLASPRTITLAAVVDWTNTLKREGAAFTPPGAKKAMRGNSPTAINTAVDALRRILDIAVERGQISGNPARQKPPEGRLKKKVVARRLTLPRLDEFQALFSEMEAGSGRAGWGLEIADFCRFLAYSGARRGEAAAVSWKDVDWERKQVFLPGTKTDAAPRWVPLFPPLAELLRKVHVRRLEQAPVAVNGKPHLAPGDKVFKVAEAQRSIDRACEKLGIGRLRHHDFRHAAATVWVEAGTDLPTVARWLGHRDGGVLAMRTYGHLRDEHSQAAAAKITWGTGGAA